MKKRTDLPEWHALDQHFEAIKNQHMRDWFAQDPLRFRHFSLQQGEIFFDFSRNRIQKETIALLTQLAHAVDLPSKIEALFSGQPINTTENRAVLHTALRDHKREYIAVNGKNIVPELNMTQEKMRRMVKKIHHRDWWGASGKPIEHVVNIGIGGSHLGPMMCATALKDYAQTDLDFHFISTVDKASVLEVLTLINPETTLFIISSKTFSTIETLTNARTIVAWMQDKVGPEALKHHFIAVTAATQKAIEFGIPPDHILPLWDFVGGRYSVWSAIGLPLMLMLGKTHFDAFLQGAYEMDTHFRKASFTENMPVLLGLLSVWYRNFFGTHVQAIIPYAHKLRYLIAYLQQAEMESNGKSINLNGEELSYCTGPVIFGEEGCNGQHAYHQLLLQGKHLIPADFIIVGKTKHCDGEHQDILIASALSQAQALMRGKTFAEASSELKAQGMTEEEAHQLAHHRAIPGNRPNNILFLEQLSPKNLGALLALYEHKIFVEGVIWDINSFDQWGVELGKQLLPGILQDIQGKAREETDVATLALIKHFRLLQGQT